MNMLLKSRRIATSLGAVALAAYIPVASAFVITSQLSGDIRAANPDNISVNVTIDVTGNTANWTVDLASPLHPSASLHEFYFNLLTGPTYSFGSFSPATWAVLPAGDVQGAGGLNNEFMFVADGPNNTVTNTVDLTFVMTASVALTPEHFLNAAVATSNDAGSGQLGAHVGGLGVGGGQSGFAFGSYACVEACNGTIPPGQIPVPEPGSLALLGSTLLGFIWLRRRKA